MGEGRAFLEEIGVAQVRIRAADEASAHRIALLIRSRHSATAPSLQRSEGFVELELYAHTLSYPDGDSDGGMNP
ncbi:hypothetical protein [Wenjunlia tyrosinilytica]|uniref:Uncharacterized protein n=1 Tax=Wenjunlia tyrosinilytica TaxID=1544741 RepID=A0A917ZY17_9ACTN|nr:hypothetical protein [Wenjunlia tyrosinilytica]GGP00781.1 hypothetical protein GCM10012280_70290 [Wenjunlia tyrosinilytica]